VGLRWAAPYPVATRGCLTQGGTAVACDHLTEGSRVDEFLAAQAALKAPGVAGWWVEVLADLDPERKASLLAAAASPKISHRAIAVVLSGWGYQVSAQQVGYWRRSHVG